MDARQKAIQEVYGKHYKQNKINILGWFEAVDPKTDKPEQNGFKLEDVDVLSSLKWRPKSLRGIEDNNGWIKIESESDLPKDDSVLYDLSNIEDKMYLIAENLYRLIDFYKTGTITHYAVHAQRKPPIY